MAMTAAASRGTALGGKGPEGVKPKSGRRVAKGRVEGAFWPGVALLAVTLGAAPAARAAVYQVSTVPQLQAAIDSVNLLPAPGGDTIQLAPGTYLLGPGNPLPCIRQPVTLLGDPSAPTVIDGGGALQTGSIICLRHRAGQRVWIQFLTLQNAYTAVEGGSGDLHLEESALIDNAGFGVVDADSGGIVHELVNVTISGHPAGSPGSRSVGVLMMSATAKMNHVTITGNDVGFWQDGGVVNVSDSIIYGNVADCWWIRFKLSDVSMTSTLTGTGACASSLDPLLGPLAYNGGPTRTHAIGAGSPAIDQGLTCLPTDQRGYPVVGRCDLGAFEYGAGPAPVGNTQPGSPVTVTLAGPAGPAQATVTFGTVTAAGDTTLTTGGTGPLPPPGYAPGAVFHDLATTAATGGALLVCLDDGPLAMPPGTARALLRYASGAWTDVTALGGVGAQVCGFPPGLGTFAILPRDVAPPVLQLPAGASSFVYQAGGALVGYTVTATDNLDPVPAVACTPASGGFFAYSPVPASVTCTATDAAGNASVGTFSIQVTDPGFTSASGVDVRPIDPASGAAPATLNFSNVTSPGLTTVAAAPACPAAPGGFQVGTPPVCWELHTTAGYAGTITVCIDYGAATFGPGQAPALLHFENGAWVDVTVPGGVGTVVCGAVSTLSPFAVMGKDGTPPRLVLPGDLAADATGPGGAVVVFQVTAIDDVDPAPRVACAPPSGSLFPIDPPGGPTTVTCTATDAAGNASAPGGFQVHVRGAGEQLAALAAQVRALPCDHGERRELEALVAEAARVVARGRRSAACGALRGLDEELGEAAREGEQWHGHHDGIPAGDAAALLAVVARIQAVLTCPRRFHREE